MTRLWQDEKKHSSLVPTSPIRVGDNHLIFDNKNQQASKPPTGLPPRMGIFFTGSKKNTRQRDPEYLSRKKA
jgi:hypothetical protein